MNKKSRSQKLETGRHGCVKVTPVLFPGASGLIFGPESCFYKHLLTFLYVIYTKSLKLNKYKEVIYNYVRKISWCLVKHQAMQTYGEVEIIALRILNLATRRN
jgi:hypothetical protein